jgi:hypothetical protein
MWKAESEEVRAHWKATAEQVKEEHLKQHPGYSYQPRKPSEKKRRMTKRKAAALQSLADAPATVNGNQMTVAPQLPLPSFSYSPDDPMLMEFTVGQGPAAIETLGQMIDQHNNSHVALPNNIPSVAISSNVFTNVTEGYDSVRALFPSAQMGYFGEGFAADNAIVGGESFDVVGAAASATAEQERQQLLSEEVFDWDAFSQASFAGFESAF